MLAKEGIHTALSCRWWEATAQNILQRMAMASDDRAEPELIQETTAPLLEATAADVKGGEVLEPPIEVGTYSSGKGVLVPL
jgi:hypothetical protein